MSYTSSLDLREQVLIASLLSKYTGANIAHMHLKSSSVNDHLLGSCSWVELCYHLTYTASNNLTPWIDTEFQVL